MTTTAAAPRFKHRERPLADPADVDGQRSEQIGLAQAEKVPPLGPGDGAVQPPAQRIDELQAIAHEQHALIGGERRREGHHGDVDGQHGAEGERDAECPEDLASAPCQPSRGGPPAYSGDLQERHQQQQPHSLGQRGDHLHG